MKITKKRLMEIIQEEVSRDAQEKKGIIPEEKIDEAHFSEDLFNLYYELKEEIGDEQLLVEVMRIVPEKIMSKVLQKIASIKLPEKKDK
ncbi:MAG: hypothetical protein Q8P81_00660 [Nanoarchaeota archaeon]|nr:hypothetical protein [Nanoarchaeota archaeon]